MNQEETIWDIQNRVIEMGKKLDKLIPVIRDVSKYIMEAKRVVDDTSFPRRQPNIKVEIPMCGHCEGKNKAVYVHEECYHYGLCKECYDKGSELRFPKEEYKPVKQPKKKEEKIVFIKNDIFSLIKLAKEQKKTEEVLKEAEKLGVNTS